MDKLNESLDYQQKVSEAAEAIFEHLRTNVYIGLLDSMLKAQYAIMEMTAKYHEMRERLDEDEPDWVFHEDITKFIWEVSEIYMLIRPFAELEGQIGYKFPVKEMDFGQEGGAQ